MKNLAFKSLIMILVLIFICCNQENNGKTIRYFNLAKSTYGNNQYVWDYLETGIDKNHYKFFHTKRDTGLAFRDFYLIYSSDGSVYYSDYSRRNKIKLFDLYGVGDFYWLPIDLIMNIGYKPNALYYDVMRQRLYENRKTRLDSVTIVGNSADETIYKSSLSIIDSMSERLFPSLVFKKCNIYWGSKSRFIGIEHTQYDMDSVQGSSSKTFFIRQDYLSLVDTTSLK